MQGFVNMYLDDDCFQCMIEGKDFVGFAKKDENYRASASIPIDRVVLGDFFSDDVRYECKGSKVTDW